MVHIALTSPNPDYLKEVLKKYPELHQTRYGKGWMLIHRAAEGHLISLQTLLQHSSPEDTDQPTVD